MRRLAAAGVAAVGLRQIAIRAMGLGGTVVLARILLPRDLGTVAIGLTVVTVFGFVGDAGLGSALIRGRQTPDRSDLASVLGFQVLITLVLTMATALIGLHFGLVGGVTALMVASMPVMAFRVPGVILYERSLLYRPLVIIELVETATYYVWAIATVLLGWGVWGLASATLARSIVGAVAINARSPAGFLWPQLSWRRVRPLLAFGFQYQAVNAVSLVRDQGLNIGVAAIAGISVLGLWSLAYRVLQVPFLLFDSLWRVSFPGMARLLAAGDEDPGPIMERGLALAALVTGGVLAALVGSAPSLIPAVFGDRWSPAGSVIPWAALGLMFGGPVSVATAGYLYARGDSGSVLLSAIAHTAAWFAVGFPLLRILGVQALGIGWLAASAVEAIVLGLRTRTHTPMKFMRHLAMPAALGAAASTIGWVTAVHVGPSLISAIVGAAVAGSTYLVAVALLRRKLLIDAIGIGRRSLGLAGSSG